MIEAKDGKGEPQESRELGDVDRRQVLEELGKRPRGGTHAADELSVLPRVASGTPVQVLILHALQWGRVPFGGETEHAGFADNQSLAIP